MNAIRRAGEISRILLWISSIVVIAGCSAGAWYWHGSRPPALGRAKMAVEFEVLNAREMIGEAEIYLSVEHSAAPGVRALFPINVGSEARYHGYLAVPFAPKSGESMVFSLLDDDRLTREEEKLLFDAARATGHVIWIGMQIYANKEGLIIPPSGKEAVQEMMSVLASAQVMALKRHPFKDMGSAVYVVEARRERHPRNVNPITLLQKGAGGWGRPKARMQIRVFYPE